MKLDELNQKITDWSNEYSVSPATIKVKTNYIKKFCEYACKKGKELDSFTKADFEEYVDYRQYSYATAKTVMSALRAFYDYIGVKNYLEITSQIDACGYVSNFILDFKQLSLKVDSMRDYPALEMSKEIECDKYTTTRIAAYLHWLGVDVNQLPLLRMEDVDNENRIIHLADSDIDYSDSEYDIIYDEIKLYLNKDYYVFEHSSRTRLVKITYKGDGFFRSQNGAKSFKNMYIKMKEFNLFYKNILLSGEFDRAWKQKELNGNMVDFNLEKTFGRKTRTITRQIWEDYCNSRGKIFTKNRK